MTSRERQFHDFYMSTAFEAGKLSRCKRKKVGAIIVLNGNILSYGFNGTPSGFCNNCENEKNETKQEVLHAESNALMKCLTNGNSPVSADFYMSVSPCIECAKLIIQAKIKNVYYKEKYRKHSGIKLLEDAGIRTHKL